jgi:hypothetical protein
MAEQNKQQKKNEENEKITVSKQDLQDMLKQREEAVEEKFKEKIATLEEKTSILEEAADKAQLQHVLSKHYPAATSQKIRLNTLDGKVVTSWAVSTDIVEKNQNGAWVEKQTMKVILEDGSTQQLPYLSFHEKIRANQVEATIKSETKNADGTITYLVQREDTGDELEIPAAFVN